LRELEALAERLQNASVNTDFDLGQVLDLQGCALRALGRSTEAIALHERARTLLQKELPPDHPFLVRNALYREAAAGNWERFRAQAERLGMASMPNSIWKKLLDSAAASSECRSRATGPCVIVL
jgi:hypothetical protein